MDAKRAEYLMNICRKEQAKAYHKWTSLPASAQRRVSEAARLETAEWAKAGDELYAILERKELLPHGHQKEERR